MDGGVPPPTTVAAAARPVRSSVVPSESLLLSGPGVARPNDVCPEQRPAGLERSGVVAVVDTASRHATASVTGVQQAVSTHPVSASGIRPSSRPVSGHLAVVVQRVRRSDGCCPAICCPAVRCPSVRVSSRLVSALVGPDASVSSHSGGGGGDQVEVAGATLATGTGGGPVAAGPSTARRRSRRPARGRRCRHRVGRWEVGGGPGGAGVGAGRGGRACPPSDQAGQAAVRSAGRGRLRCGHGAGCSAR
jgi:hypothetical protein